MYKQGSDITLILTLKDNAGDPLLISSLAGYGIEIYGPDDNSIGKYGTLTGYDAGGNIFKPLGDSGFELNLGQDIYGDIKGQFKAEIQIAYTDTDYSDGLRNLFSTKKHIFTIGNETTNNCADTDSSDCDLEFTFEVENITSISNIYGPYDTPADAANDNNLPDSALYYLSGNVPGTMKNQIFIKK